MPTYTYLCSECEHRFDTVQRISEDPLTECPACGKSTLVRQISAVGFALKGSGWYVTDFRDKGKPQKTDGKDGKSEGGASASDAAPPAATGGADGPAKAATSGD